MVEENIKCKTCNDFRKIDVAIFLGHRITCRICVQILNSARFYVTDCVCAASSRVKAFMSRLPDAYRGFDKPYVNRPLRDQVINEARKKKIVVLSSGTGNGKTWCAVNVACLWIQEGKTFSFVEAGELGSHYFGTQGSRGYVNEEDGKAYMSNLKDRIIINDLGVGESGRAAFGDCLREMFDYKKNVIVTSNLSGEDLRDLYKDRVSTYLKEACPDSIIISKGFREVGDRR